MNNDIVVFSHTGQKINKKCKMKRKKTIYEHTGSGGAWQQWVPIRRQRTAEGTRHERLWYQMHHDLVETIACVCDKKKNPEKKQ